VTSSKGDVAVTFIDANQLPAKEPRKGWRGRFFHSEKMTFAYYAVEAGAWIHEHSHPNDEVWNIIDGQLEITIAGEARVVGPGCAALIPPDTPHSVKALSNSRVIVVDHPQRHSIGGIELLGACGSASELAIEITQIALNIRQTRRQDSSTTSARPVGWKR
jgi:quercetin dioxygenase-like cupin family protein